MNKSFCSEPLGLRRKLIALGVRGGRADVLSECEYVQKVIACVGL
jgi:hypothetical protein